VVSGAPPLEVLVSKVDLPLVVVGVSMFSLVSLVEAQPIEKDFLWKLIYFIKIKRFEQSLRFA